MIDASRTKAFYGWRIVGASLLVHVVSSGIGFYGHSVLLDPLREQHGWPKGLISSAITMYFITSGLVGLLISRFVDRYGPRPSVAIGGLIAGLSLMMLAFIDRGWQLFAVYVIMAAGFSGTSLIAINTLIANWFIRRRGLAMSITMSGLSLGGIIIVPFATWLIAESGLKTALTSMGILYAAVCIPIALFVFKRRPSDIGQFPDGSPPSAMPAPERGISASSISRYMAAQSRKWTRRGAMGTRAFWAITVSFCLGLTGQIGFLMHQISFLSITLGRSEAAAAVSITAAASIAGRLALGAVVDRLDKRVVTMGLLISQTAAILAMAFSNHPAVLYGGTFVFGLTMGSLLMMHSLITGDCFGIVSYGTVFAVSNLFVIAGSAFGPVVAGVIFDLTKSYRISFTCFAVLSLLAAVTILFTTPPETAD